tara:strand:- start:415 stop:693 length:279 start_codon:yes stop_codon:yes gene_type:complete
MGFKLDGKMAFRVFEQAELINDVEELWTLETLTEAASSETYTFISDHRTIVEAVVAMALLEHAYPDKHYYVSTPDYRPEGEWATYRLPTSES